MQTRTLKIYKLSIPNHDAIYIGSTIEKSLNIRLSKHKYDSTYKQSNLYKFVSIFGWDAVSIHLVDEMPYIDKKDKLYLESHYINTLKPLLNQRLPII
jgi:hypothetical protein